MHVLFITFIYDSLSTKIVNDFTMIWRVMRNILAVLISTSLIGLAACQKAGPTPVVIEPTPPAVIPVSQKIEGQENYCLSCHSDKEQLIATAKPEEMVESESSGAG